ncbi:hypothetical protein BU26DRAFT_500050 [Trematosphaeria pertusa]|uniref:Uncharacterized protein n=1 Tax=Trematosphaeria pertusa TaxID=390896 RepID=A0A6A6IUZ6_9PLEO|nr:uncharacterized protein BU26DRAFT_500050 [Trematosphaeria pertusa]KAF2254264.1 hypothetical protein BU26DRAFT_500050 [Trematosphaeria pertusa]
MFTGQILPFSAGDSPPLAHSIGRRALPQAQTHTAFGHNFRASAPLAPDEQTTPNAFASRFPASAVFRCLLLSEPTRSRLLPQPVAHFPFLTARQKSANASQTHERALLQAARDSAVIADHLRSFLERIRKRKPQANLINTRHISQHSTATRPSSSAPKPPKRHRDASTTTSIEPSADRGSRAQVATRQGMPSHLPRHLVNIREASRRVPPTTIFVSIHHAGTRLLFHSTSLSNTARSRARQRGQSAEAARNLAEDSRTAHSTSSSQASKVRSTPNTGAAPINITRTTPTHNRQQRAQTVASRAPGEPNPPTIVNRPSSPQQPRSRGTSPILRHCSSGNAASYPLPCTEPTFTSQTCIITSILAGLTHAEEPRTNQRPFPSHSLTNIPQANASSASSRTNPSTLPAPLHLPAGSAFGGSAHTPTPRVHLFLSPSLIFCIPRHWHVQADIDHDDHTRAMLGPSTTPIVSQPRRRIPSPRQRAISSRLPDAAGRAIVNESHRILDQSPHPRSLNHLHQKRGYHVSHHTTPQCNARSPDALPKAARIRRIQNTRSRKRSPISLVGTLAPTRITTPPQPCSITQQTKEGSTRANRPTQLSIQCSASQPRSRHRTLHITQCHEEALSAATVDKASRIQTRRHPRRDSQCGRHCAQNTEESPVAPSAARANRHVLITTQLSPRGKSYVSKGLRRSEPNTGSIYPISAHQHAPIPHIPDNILNGDEDEGSSNSQQSTVRLLKGDLITNAAGRTHDERRSPRRQRRRRASRHESTIQSQISAARCGRPQEGAPSTAKPPWPSSKSPRSTTGQAANVQRPVILLHRTRTAPRISLTDTFRAQRDGPPVRSTTLPKTRITSKRESRRQHTWKPLQAGTTRQALKLENANLRAALEVQNEHTKTSTDPTEDQTQSARTEQKRSNNRPASLTDPTHNRHHDAWQTYGVIFLGHPSRPNGSTTSRPRASRSFNGTPLLAASRTLSLSRPQHYARHQWDPH